MKVRSEIAALEKTLSSLGRRERAEGEKRYLKSDFDFLGVTMPQLRSQTKAWLRSHPDLTVGDLRRMSRALFARRTHELKMVAILLLQYRSTWLEPSDLDMLEQMLRRAYTWAYVDALAIHVAGSIVQRYPESVTTIDAWARDDDFWIRRSALLSLLVPLHHGHGDWNRFTAYADLMLEERQFFIRKAIGWILRDVSKKHPKRVSTFVRGRIQRISGVTLREAVKYLGTGDRTRLTTEYHRYRKAGNSTR